MSSSLPPSHHTLSLPPTYLICTCIEATRETVLADEDQEQDPDRWVSHTRLLARVLANPLAMGLESALGVRPARVCFSHAFDRTGLFSD